jgi:hypothetical protein
MGPHICLKRKTNGRVLMLPAMIASPGEQGLSGFA